MTVKSQIEFDRDRASQYNLDKCQLGNFSIRLDGMAREKAQQNFQSSIDNSVYFVSETRIIDLLQQAEFSDIVKFYNAFLFGGWGAEFRGFSL